MLTNKGQSTAHHWGWMLVVLIIFGVGTYFFTINRPDDYTGHSIHAEQHRQDWPLSIHIFEGGCARLDQMKALGGTNAINNTTKTSH